MANKLIYVVVQKRDSTGAPWECFAAAVDRTDIYPLWRLWGQFPDAMICPAGTAVPCDNLYVNLATSTEDKIYYDAIAWDEKHEPLRQQLLALVPCQ